MGMCPRRSQLLLDKLVFRCPRLRQRYLYLMSALHHDRRGHQPIGTQVRMTLSPCPLRRWDCPLADHWHRGDE